VRIASKDYLIYDNALMFNIDYLAYNLVSSRTGVEAPNMNSIMKRFSGSLRREALDNFRQLAEVRSRGFSRSASSVRRRDGWEKSSKNFRKN
jgi:hypothetical protein